MIYPKVLIGAPIHKYKDYCVHDWLRHVCTKLTYPRHRYKVMVVDNSEDKAWHRQFIGLYPNLHVVHYQKSKANEHWTVQQVIAECQNKIVNYGMRNGYQQLFSNECDNFYTPNDVIELLQRHSLPVVGAFYQHGFGDKRFHMIQKMDAPVAETVLVSNRYRLMEHAETLPMIDGKLHPVGNIGVGCLLFQMWVFNYVRFHSDAAGKGLSDSYLSADLKNALGIDIMCDTSINCGHQNDSWGWKKEVELFKGRQMA